MFFGEIPVRKQIAAIKKTGSKKIEIMHICGIILNLKQQLILKKRKII